MHGTSRANRAPSQAHGTTDVFKEDLRAAPGRFEPESNQLLHRERAQFLALFMERTRFNGAAGEIEIRFRAGGIKVLALERAA